MKRMKREKNGLLVMKELFLVRDKIGLEEYPIYFYIRHKPKQELQYQLVLQWGEYPIIIKSSRKREVLEKEFRILRKKTTVYKREQLYTFKEVTE